MYEDGSDLYDRGGDRAIIKFNMLVSNLLGNMIITELYGFNQVQITWPSRKAIFPATCSGWQI